MKIFLQLIILTLAQFSLAANATPIDTPFYAGAELGIPIGSDQANSVSQELIASLRGSASAYQSGTVEIGRIFGGYKALENMDIEVGIFQSTESTLPFSGKTGPRPISLPYSGIAHSSAYGINYAALFRPAVESGWRHVFLRIGGHWSKLETNSTITILGNSTYTHRTEAGSGLLYGLGYEASLHKTIDWRVQITRSHHIAGKSETNTSVVSLAILKKF